MAVEEQVPRTDRIFSRNNKPVDDRTAAKWSVGMGAAGMISSVMLVLLSLVSPLQMALNKEKRMTHETISSERKARVIFTDCPGGPKCDEDEGTLSVWDLLRASEAADAAAALKQQCAQHKVKHKPASVQPATLPGKLDEGFGPQRPRVYCEAWQP